MKAEHPHVHAISIMNQDWEKTWKNIKELY